jgi:hypothetical protein
MRALGGVLGVSKRYLIFQIFFTSLLFLSSYF